MKVIKWILGILTILVLLVAIGLAYVLFAIDPNSYKPQLAELAKEQNITLNIEGDLSWQWLPNLALSIGATHIASPRGEIPDIHFEQADLSLAWLPLLKRQLSIKAIRLDKADIRIGTAEQASNTAIAPLAVAKTNDSTPAPDNAESTPAFTLAIERLEIDNSRLQLPASDNAAHPQQLSDINLLAQGLNLDGDTFKLKVKFDYKGPALPTPLAVALNTDASIEQHKQTFTLSDTVLNLLLTDKPPIKISLETLSAGQPDTPHLAVSGLQLSSGGASLQASLAVQTLNDSIAFDSDINVPPLALRNVLALWQIDLPDLPDKTALQQASLKLNIKGHGDNLSIDDFQLSLDDVVFNGHAKVAFGATRSLALQLQGSTIDLNRYISSANASNTNKTNTSDKSQTKAAATSPSSLFAPLVAPLLWVGDGHAALDINLDGVNFDTIAAEKLQLNIKAAKQIATITQLSGQVFDGEMKATASINLQGKEPRVNFHALISALSVDKALTAVNGDAALTGNLDAKLQGQTHGSTADQLHQSLNANGEITLAKPRLNTFNIEKSYCDIAALVEKIPRKNDWPQGSNLQDLQATLKIQGKQVFIEHYTTGLGNISLQGEGLVDLSKERFDLLAVSRLNGDRTSEQGCQVKSKRVRNKDIPIRCKDRFAQAGASSCKPDGNFVKQILQDKLLKKLQKQDDHSEKSGSNEALKSLLKGLLGN